MLRTEAINALLVLFLLTEIICLAGVLGDLVYRLCRKKRAARLMRQRRRQTKEIFGAIVADGEGKVNGPLRVRARL